ncbi:MAG: sugar phosphate isomerase/epimerase [Phycisphaerae bacterium]|nr:sugar phosphate isomerase/epimerase [Phycisphaerae bacterium]MDW8260938.1 sugar phosphate isomerase/epimerase [Phycisphaerales bacterium]
MNIDGHDIGVCSWSLRPRDLDDLFQKVRRLGLSHVQLAVADFVSADDASCQAMIRQVASSGLKLTATMIHFPGEDYTTIASIRRTGGYVPDDRWNDRKAASVAAGRITRDLGVNKLSTHVGFVPPSSDPAYATIVGRVGEIAGELASLGVSLLMETGQEAATELLQFLNDLRCRNVGINFDPANMILYGAGDPIEAIRTLGRHIWHVHVKDAVGSDHPGTNWGEEVPFGSGQVPVTEFLNELDSVGYRGPLVIEREAGEDRLADVATAIRTLQGA